MLSDQDRLTDTIMSTSAAPELPPDALAKLTKLEAGFHLLVLRKGKTWARVQGPQALAITESL